ncbi:IS110 family transposase [Paenibacillus sp. MSJ-34]|uniref:IS110 family transposase n=1 Tax=Paenibacillus sp. MSJ-34 TaxID=2841529 RepID=UPI001C10AB19|nr:IS110 family transposase [Paenibacillus sp. MSJ-34]MBU5445205.1 IS110 family transposase [Paenibacillus sp. MSJ-34]
MNHSTKYVGLDVSKAKIAVAIADEGRQEARFWGVIEHTEEAVRKLMQKLRPSEDVVLEVCYESGPTGNVLYRWLLAMNIACTIVAPSLVPQRAGDRVKTDRRDALRLAQLFRAGELTSVYVPSPEDEALRDLVRAREDAKEDMNRHKQRLGKFLLRNQLSPSNGAKPWTHKYEEWLDTLRFSDDCKRTAFQEYRQTIRETQERMKRYEKEIERQAQSGVQAPLIQALQALKGVAVITAATLASEIFDITRFPSAGSFMSYCGLVPSESSSGVSRWQGNITKAGNAHLRRVLVESAWHYRHPPGIRKKLRERMPDLPPGVQAIAWEAQSRLYKKCKGLQRRGKHSGCVITSIARELAGFVWAIARELEKQKQANVA